MKLLSAYSIALCEVMGNSLTLALLRMKSHIHALTPLRVSTYDAVEGSVPRHAPHRIPEVSHHFDKTPPRPSRRQQTSAKVLQSTCTSSPPHQPHLTLKTHRNNELPPHPLPCRARHPISNPLHQTRPLHPPPHQHPNSHRSLRMPPPRSPNSLLLPSSPLNSLNSNQRTVHLHPLRPNLGTMAPLHPRSLHLPQHLPRQERFLSHRVLLRRNLRSPLRRMDLLHPHNPRSRRQQQSRERHRRHAILLGQQSHNLEQNLPQPRSRIQKPRSLPSRRSRP